VQGVKALVHDLHFMTACKSQSPHDQITPPQRNLTHLLQDPFGNYVVQTALSIAEGDQQLKVCNVRKTWALRGE
jgi:hypothetical protein